MTLLHLALGILMNMANDTPDLVLESKTTTRNDEIIMKFFFRNRGRTDRSVVLEDYYCQFIPQLFDAKGKERKSWDRRSTHGARAEPREVKASPLPAGGTLEVGYLRLAPKRRNASSRYQDWNLGKVRAQTFSVQFTYRMPQEMADRAASRGAPGAIVGEWTSPRFDLVYRR